VAPNEAVLSSVNAQTSGIGYDSGAGTGGVFIYNRFAESTTDSCNLTAFNTSAAVNNANTTSLLLFNHGIPFNVSTTNACGITTIGNVSQYQFLTINTDDSSVFTFPDSSTWNSHTTISGISLYNHTALGVPTGGRLRGGQTTNLGGSTQNILDSQP
jgi:hypothetical protein